MKQLRTKVLLSAFVLLFALVATIGSTFAWFTVATTVNVESMQLNVQSQDSLLIRMAYNDGTIKGDAGDDNLFDATQYKTTLTLTDIQEYFDFTAGGGWRLEPVTVINSTYTGFNGKNMSVLSTGSNLTRALTAIDEEDDINSNTGKVIQVSFFLFSQGEVDADIILQDLSITTSMTGVAAQVVDAVRLSAWRAGYQQAAVLVEPTSPEVFVPEAGHTAHVFGRTIDYGFAFTAANPTYYYGGLEPSLVNGFNSLSDISLDTTEYNSLFHKSTGFSAIDSVTGDIGTKAGADVILTLDKNVPTLVTVRIFVEGWAANTTNNIIAAAFSISYKFSIQDVA